VIFSFFYSSYTLAPSHILHSDVLKDSPNTHLLFPPSFFLHLPHAHAPHTPHTPLCPNTHKLHTALRTVGNIVTGDDAQTQLVINLNALPALLWMLDNSKKNIRKEACWTLSNVTAGTAEQIQSVINACVFPKLIQLLGSSEFDIQKEAAWAVSNATSGGSPSQIMYLAQQGTLRYAHHPIRLRPYSPFVHIHTSCPSTPLLSL
jgi:hypothetical protein